MHGDQLRHTLLHKSFVAFVTCRAAQSSDINTPNVQEYKFPLRSDVNEALGM